MACALLTATFLACQRAGSVCTFYDCCSGLYCEDISWEPDRWCAKLGHPAFLRSYCDACAVCGCLL